MAGGDVSPVVVPIVAQLDKSALSELGPAVRSAREAGVAGASAAQAGAPSAVSVNAVVREAAALERSLHGLTEEVDRLLRVIQARGPVPAGGAAAPPLPPGGAPPGATPPPGGGSWFQAAAGVFLGQFAERTLSGALRRGFNEVQHMAASARSMKEAAYLAASVRGDAGDASTLLGELHAGLGFKRKASPEAIERSIQQLALTGMKPTGRDAMLLAELGLTTMGSPEAATQFATSMFRDTRSTRALEILASIDQNSKASGHNTAEQVRQFEGLTGFFRGIQGSRRVSPEEEERRLKLGAYLTDLPGGIGEGEGAVRLQSNIFAAAQSDPIGRAMKRAAFMRTHPGVDPFTPSGAVQMALWEQSADLIPEMVKESERWGGGNPDVTTLYRIRHVGMSPTDAKALEDATPEERARFLQGLQEKQDRLLGRAQAEGNIARQARVDATDAGARSMASRSTLAWKKITDDFWSEPQIAGEGILSKIPYGPVAWEAAKGLGAFGGGLLGGSALRRARRWWRGARSAASAGAVGPSARQALNVGRLARAGGYLAGGAALANEVSDAAASPEDSWWSLVKRNAFPTLVGGAGTLLTKNPAVGAGLFGGAHWLQSLLTGGDTTSPASAAIPPSLRAVGGDGWSADAVAEHLNLLRTIATGTDARVPSFVGPGPSARSANLTPMRADGRGGPRISPYDPRIDAAAAEFGIPADDFRAIIKQESGFNPLAVSPKGAKGLGQLMPGTARDRGVSNPFDVRQNLRGSAAHYARLLRKFKGDRTLAMAAYNAGEGNVAKYGGVPPFAETRDYVRKVQRHAREFGGVDRERLQTALDGQGTPAGEPAAVRASRDLAEFERLLMDRRFGPEEDGPSRVVVQLEPGPGLAGIVQPSHAPIPGPRRTR